MSPLIETAILRDGAILRERFTDFTAYFVVLGDDSYHLIAKTLLECSEWRDLLSAGLPGDLGWWEDMINDDVAFSFSF